MKLIPMIAVTILAGAMSLSALAAQEITKKDAKKYTKVGTVTTSEMTAPEDAKAELSKLADEKGGQYYVITSGNKKGKIHATANVYKDKK